MAQAILSYRQKDKIKLLCKIDLKKLLPTPKEKERFDKNWNDFLKSDPCNEDIFELEGDRLKYDSEQLISSKSDDRAPLLLVLGNPASHSVKAGMFFALEKGKTEHRFWKDILKKSGVLKLNTPDHLRSVKEIGDDGEILTSEIGDDGEILTSVPHKIS